jgi:hypothetical protein
MKRAVFLIGRLSAVKCFIAHDAVWQQITARVSTKWLIRKKEQGGLREVDVGTLAALKSRQKK